MPLPITEQANQITRNIDVATPLDITSLLQECNKEIFEGWEEYKNLFDSSVVEAIKKIAGIIRETFKVHENGTVVISGCGTSGRLAFMVARTFNVILNKLGHHESCQYIIAGEDKALLTSQEAPEDDPMCGMELLIEKTEDHSNVVFIGVTCGLSAPFVAGQLSYCLHHLNKYTPVLLGFNLPEMARNNPIENWNKTFFQVTQEMLIAEKSGKGFILNPIVGPEPITGSSRMKSGSATKILLETIFLTSLDGDSSKAESYLKCYKCLCDDMFAYDNQIATLVDFAGQSLRADGHIYYLGSDGAGIVGLIDASECPPTYGADLSDIRGFVVDGYDALGNERGNISHLGEYFHISVQAFEHSILPQLNLNDLVIINAKGEDEPITLPADFWGKACKKALVSCDLQKYKPTVENGKFDVVIDIQLPVKELSNLIGQDSALKYQGLFAEMMLKWVCNAVTTGAHILKGKVYENTMVDLKVSNNKLFHRAVGIIQKYSKCSLEEAKSLLLRSIHEVDELNSEIEKKSISEHIKIATPKERVVPTAIILGVLRCKIKEARDALDVNPIIRSALVQTLGENFSS